MMINKKFSERLNKELDDIGVSLREDERIEIFAKMFKISKIKAESILTGRLIPEPLLLEKIIQEFEIPMASLFPLDKAKKDESF